MAAPVAHVVKVAAGRNTFWTDSKIMCVLILFNILLQYVKYSNITTNNYA